MFFYPIFGIYSLTYSDGKCCTIHAFSYVNSIYNELQYITLMKKFNFTSLPSYKINYFIQMKSWKLGKIFFFLSEITQHLSLKHIFAVGPLFLWLGVFLEIDWSCKKWNFSWMTISTSLKWLKSRKGKEKIWFFSFILVSVPPMQFHVRSLEDPRCCVLLALVVFITSHWLLLKSSFLIQFQWADGSWESILRVILNGY